MKYIIIFLLAVTSLQAQTKKKTATAPVRTAAARVYQINDIPGLSAALDSKQNKIATGNTSQYITGNGTLVNAPTALSAFANDVGFVKKYFEFETRTSDFVLSAPDDGKFIDAVSPTAIKVTLPNTTTTPFRVGTQITITKIGAGDVVFIAETGVTVLTVKSGTKLIDINTVATVTYKGNNTWQIIGDLAP